MADAVTLTDRPLGHELPATDRRGAVRFVLLLAAVIGVVFGVIRPLIFGGGFARWPWIAAAVIAGAVLLAPATALLIHGAWMRFARVMQAVNTTLILGLVYALMIVPIGLVRRLFGAASVRNGIDHTLDTYRIPAARSDVRTRMEKPY